MRLSAAIAVTLFLTANNLSAFAENQLTLHFSNPPLGLDWSSPQALTYSTLINALVDKIRGLDIPIGHVIEDLECGTYHRLMGMSPDGSAEERTAILEGYGLGTMMNKYHGHLDTTEDATKVIQSMSKHGRNNFIRFQISQSTCGRLQDYIKEYEKRGLDKTYSGLNSCPLYEEGSGCSAFGASFLEVAGLLTPEFQTAWMRHLIVPYEYVGGPRTNKKVNVLKLLFSFDSHWASDPKDGVKLDFYDPELMNLWVKKALVDVHAFTSRAFPWDPQIATLENSEGIAFDARTVPTPTGDFFRKRNQ